MKFQEKWDAIWMAITFAEAGEQDTATSIYKNIRAEKRVADRQRPVRVFTQQDFQLSNLNYPRPYGNFRTGLTVSQPLFQGGEAYLGYKQAELGREMAAVMVLSARQQLLFQVIQTYYGVQLAQESLAVVKKSRQTAAEHVKIAESRYQSGAVVHADVLSGQVHLAKITQEELTAASQVEIAKSALSTVIAQPGAGSRPLSPPPRNRRPCPEN